MGYRCKACQAEDECWLGRCPECGEWNSFELEAPKKGYSHLGDRATKPIPRFKSGVDGLDIILGGGMVPGGFTLLGGEPGVGKSTLLLQLCQGVRRHQPAHKILYVNAEESVDQIEDRANRIKILADPKIFVGHESNLTLILDWTEELSPDLLILDSLQTLTVQDQEIPLGNISQMRAIGAMLMKAVKRLKFSLWLVAHVTKEGDLSGPKAVEHLVDTVLYFENGANPSERTLQVGKNRFGQSGVKQTYLMEETGLFLRDQV